MVKAIAEKAIAGFVEPSREFVVTYCLEELWGKKKLLIFFWGQL